jgi:hypothetical protein
VTDLDRLVRDDNTAALGAMISEIIKHWDEIVDLASQRCQSVGAAEYGDASFHKPATILRRERFEEYADALFYFQLEYRNRE